MCNVNDIVYFNNDKKRKRDLFIISEVDGNNVLLKYKDDTKKGWYGKSSLTIKHKYFENSITKDELKQLLRDVLNMRNFEVDLHLFPHQNDEQEYWGGYRGFVVKNQTFEILIQYENTHYVKCLLPSFSHINYFYQDRDPTFENIKKIIDGVKQRVDQTVITRKKEIELLTNPVDDQIESM